MFAGRSARTASCVRHQWMVSGGGWRVASGDASRAATQNVSPLRHATWRPRQRPGWGPVTRLSSVGSRYLN